MRVRNTLEDFGVDFGRIAALTAAVHNSLDCLPRPSSPEQEREMRTLEALVVVLDDYAQGCLARSDERGRWDKALHTPPAK